MILMDILVVCCMALALVVWVGEPFIRWGGAPSYGHADAKDSETLLLQKETLYTAIRDLEFDFQTGKVDAKDYTELRQQLEGEAIQLLRQIDHIDPLASLERDIEQHVLALRRVRRPALDQQNSFDCSYCRTMPTPPENFCPFCGRALRA